VNNFTAWRKCLQSGISILPSSTNRNYPRRSYCARIQHYLSIKTSPSCQHRNIF